MHKYGLVLCVMSQLVLFTPASSYAQSVTKEDGLNWVTWLSAGERVWKTVLRLEPKLKDVIGEGKTVAVAVKDIDFDGRNEVILHFWGAEDCGVDGCLYVVLSNDGRTKRGFMAHKFLQVGDGFNVDGRYYKL